MTTPKVALDVEQAWRIYELLEEMNHFLHQPDNLASKEDILRWLSSGVYDELSDLLYGTAVKWFEIDEVSGHVILPQGVHRRFSRT